jgi:hypothetical protein
MRSKTLALAATVSIGLAGCVSNQEPLPPGEQAARQAAFLEFTKSQCASTLGGSGVGDLTRASIALQRQAAALGVTRDYSAPDTGIATAWSISVGMQGRPASCNQFVTDAYNIMAATNTL